MSQTQEARTGVLCHDCSMTYTIAESNGFKLIMEFIDEIIIYRHLDGNNIIYVNCPELLLTCGGFCEKKLWTYDNEYYVSCGSSLMKLPHSKIEIPEPFEFVWIDVIDIPEIGGAMWTVSEEAPYINYLIYFDCGFKSLKKLLYNQYCTQMLGNGDAVHLIWLEKSRKYAAINRLGKLVTVNVLISLDSTFITPHFQIQINDYKATFTALNGGRTKTAMRIVDDE